MSAAGRKSVRVVVAGRVHGVFFRSWTLGRAEIRGLDGWVRNRRDGMVEAVFAGPADAVDGMVRECWRGPDHATVTDVRVEPADDPGETGFDQEATV